MLIVVWSHTGPPGISRVGNFGAGPYGVWLFFVLSGFLITGILLRERDSGAPLRQSLRSFYTRRLLRIFPAYYALLAILVLIGIGPILHGLGAHLAYLSNWYFIATDPPYFLGHFWSLAVEEQFYLAWPLLVLLVSPRRLPWILGMLIVVAPLTRLALALSDVNPIAVEMATTSNLDVLGLGGLLAWHHHTHPTAVAQRTRLIQRGLVVAQIIALSTIVQSAVGAKSFVVLAVTETLSAALVSTWLVDRCVVGVRGRAKGLLEWKPIVLIGTVSYAIYLVHPPIKYGVDLAVLGHERIEGSFRVFGLVTVVSTGIAAISWTFFEGPLNSLKRFIPYSARF